MSVLSLSSTACEKGEAISPFSMGGWTVSYLGGPEECIVQLHYGAGDALPDIAYSAHCLHDGVLHPTLFLEEDM